MSTLQTGFLLMLTLFLALLPLALCKDHTLISHIKDKIPVDIQNTQGRRTVMVSKDQFEGVLANSGENSLDISRIIESSAIILPKETFELNSRTMMYRVTAGYYDTFHEVNVNVPGKGGQLMELCGEVPMKGLSKLGQDKDKVGSGFLVGPQQMVVSGHLIETQADCDNIAIRFNYMMRDDSETASSSSNSAGGGGGALSDPHKEDIQFNEIAYCHNIVKNESKKTSLAGDNGDYTVINLQWEVDRQYMKLASTQSFSPAVRGGEGGYRDSICADGLGEDTSLFTFGYPHGVPMQVEEFEKVKDIDSDRGYFSGNFNTFPGSFGSPIINFDNKVVGIIAKGQQRDNYIRKNSEGSIENDWCAAVKPYDSTTEFKKASCVSQFSKHIMSPIIPFPSFTKGVSDERVKAMKVLLGQTNASDDVDGFFGDSMDQAIKSIAYDSIVFKTYIKIGDKNILNPSMISALVGVTPVKLQLEKPGPDEKTPLRKKKNGHLSRYGSCITLSFADGLASNNDKLFAVNFLLSKHLKKTRSASINPDNMKRDIKQFQNGAGITIDGIVGPQTWRYLFSEIKS